MCSIQLLKDISTDVYRYFEDKLKELPDSTVDVVWHRVEELIDDIDDLVRDTEREMDFELEEMNENHEYEDMVERDYWERNAELRADSIIKYGR